MTQSGGFKTVALFIWGEWVYQRDWAAAANELGRWVYGGGRALPGLVARRDAEGQMLFSAVLTCSNEATVDQGLLA